MVKRELDYVGIVKALRKALADYTANQSGASVDPTVDKDVLIARIHDVIAAATRFLAEHGFDLQALVDTRDFEKANLLQDVANAMCVSLEVKKEYQTYASELSRLVKYVSSR